MGWLIAAIVVVVVIVVVYLLTREEESPPLDDAEKGDTGTCSEEDGEWEKEPCPEVTTGDLGVTVTDNSTGAAIEGADVAIAPAAQPKRTTDTSGKTLFSGLASGQYTVTAKKGGFEGTANATVSANKTTVVELKLWKCPTKAEFKEHGTNYGFDDHTNGAVPWKSVEKAKSDTVKAKITPPEWASRTEFVSQQPSKVTVSPAVASADDETVTVSGGDVGTSEIQGTCRGNTLGKMKAKTYVNKAKTVAVRLVHEKNYSSTDIADGDIRTFLKKVYKQAVFEFKVTRLPAKTVEFDKDGDGKVDVNSWMSDEMKEIRDACKDDSYDHNIFLVDKPSDGSTGFMDYNQRYGFVHADNSGKPESTLAHELGHGGFGLSHTPSDSHNIMYDYASATKWRLRKDQWDKINP